MRTKLIGFASIPFLFTFGFLFAQETPREINEDIQFIREWQKNNTAAELATALSLTQDQQDSLFSMREGIDGIQDEYAPLKEATLAAFEATASAVRERIEATDRFTEEDKALLKEAKMEGRLLRQEIKLRIQAATVALPELLTEEQMATLKQFFPKRDKANRGQGEGQGQGQGQGQGKNGNGGQRGGKSPLRILLSDAFLNQLSGN